MAANTMHRINNVKLVNKVSMTWPALQLVTENSSMCTNTNMNKLSTFVYMTTYPTESNRTSIIAQSNTTFY